MQTTASTAPSAVTAASRGTAISDAARRVAFRYTDNVACLTTLDLGPTTLEIVGDPENAAYEWVLSRDGRVEQHSDDAYGSPDVALRDGLIVALGVPGNLTELEYRHEHGRPFTMADFGASLKAMKDAGMAPLGSGKAS